MSSAVTAADQEESFKKMHMSYVARMLKGTKTPGDETFCLLLCYQESIYSEWVMNPQLNVEDSCGFKKKSIDYWFQMLLHIQSVKLQMLNMGSFLNNHIFGRGTCHLFCELDYRWKNKTFIVKRCPLNGTEDINLFKRVTVKK